MIRERVPAEEAIIAALEETAREHEKKQTPRTWGSFTAVWTLLARTRFTKHQLRKMRTRLRRLRHEIPNTVTFWSTTDDYVRQSDLARCLGRIWTELQHRINY